MFATRSRLREWNSSRPQKNGLLFTQAGCFWRWPLFSGNDEKTGSDHCVARLVEQSKIFGAHAGESRSCGSPLCHPASGIRFGRQGTLAQRGRPEQIFHCKAKRINRCPFHQRKDTCADERAFMRAISVGSRRRKTLYTRQGVAAGSKNATLPSKKRPSGLGPKSGVGGVFARQDAPATAG